MATASGDAIISDEGYDSPTVDDVGRVYVFDTVTCGLKRIVENPTPDEGDQFGGTLASIASGDFVTVSEFDDEDTGGTGFVFDGGEGTGFRQIHHPSPSPTLHFGAFAAGSGNDVVIHAEHPSDPTSHDEILLFTASFACGDGLVDPGEVCEQGGPGDCCKAGCLQVESANTPCRSDGNVCTNDVCNGVSGFCQHTPVPNSVACDDDDACTVEDHCQDGTCTGGAPRTCDDGSTCTTDSCDPSGGCVFTPLPDGTACSDTDACTTGQTCQGGSCGTRTQCPGDDGNACNGTEACNPATGLCEHTPAPNCDDGNPCTTDSCVPSSGCKHVNLNSGNCDDGNPCTQGTTCSAGKCQGGTLVADGTACPDTNSCTSNEQCVVGVCQVIVLADGTACSDGNACSEPDACLAGKCASSGCASGPCTITNPCGPSSPGHCGIQGLGCTCQP